MIRRPRLAAAGIVLALACSAPAGRPGAEPAPIFIDGTFGDWGGAIDHVDPAGDVVSGVDFGEVDLAHDGEWLFVRFQTTVEVGIQESGTALVLYLDTDSNASTGTPVAGIGAELQWNFGTRSGCFYPAGSCVAIAQNALRLRMLPSVSASTFEIAIGRDVRPDGATPLFPGSGFRLVLRDAASGDTAPDAGGLAYVFDPAPVAPPEPIPFARVDPADVRVVTWNTRDLESGAGFDPAVTAAADRVLSAIGPDIVCFQELYQSSAAAVRALVAGMLPGTWHAAKHADCAVASRYPVLQSWTLDGNLAVLLDADAALDADLLLVCAHLPCCSNDAGRQTEADRIMAFLRDAMTPGGAVGVPSGTAFLIAGDLNLVGRSQQLRTLLEGDIVNQGVFGPDFAPDWDGTGLLDIVSSQTERRFAYTWRSDGSAFAPGRLDFLIVNDGVLGVRRHFVVYSPEMSAGALAATGIQAGDVPTVSDHLPHVADLRSVDDLSGVPPVAAGRFSIGAARAALGRDEIRFTLELGEAGAVAIDVFDAGGRRVRSLFEGARDFLPGRHPLRWDGLGDRGERTASGVYFVRAALEGAGGLRREARRRWILLR